MKEIKNLKGEVITERDIEKYYELNEEAKSVKKEADALKEKIRDAMEFNDLEKLDCDEFKVAITNRVSKTVNDDMLAAMLINRGLKDACTITKVIPIKDSVKEAIKNGQLSQTEYDLCCDNKLSSVFSIKRN